MYIETIFNEINQTELDNNQFLAEYVKAFYLLNSNKTAALKKIGAEYIAATSGYIKLIGHKSVDEIINTTDEQAPCGLSLFSETYKQQDRLVEKCKKTLSFLEVHDFSNGLGMHVFDRVPIINPATNDIVAIGIHTEPFQTRNMLETMQSIHKKRAIEKINPAVFSSNLKLGEKQLEILFCLVIGFKEDKAIAKFINDVKNVDYGGKNIKSNIKDLFKKFNVTTRDQLIESAI